VAYYPNFYGIMEDELNGTDETDRGLISWDIHSETTVGSKDHRALRLLSIGPDGSPVVDREAPALPQGSLLCQVPDDIVVMRRLQPGLAAQWRLALRATMGRAMQAGYVATSMTRDGSYLLERNDP
jgi:predicted GNAT superfamily acetyltransferase